MDDLSIRENNRIRKQFRKIDQIDKLIDFWNDLEYVSHHKKGTQKYKKLKYMLEKLVDGTFLKWFPVAPEFAKKNFITIQPHKYSIVEIQDIMLKLSQLCSPGYSINKHNHIPKYKSLDALLYNEKYNSSYFLLVEARPPKLCSDQQIDLENLPYDEAYLETFLNRMSYGYKENLTDIKEVAIGIESLIKLHKNHDFESIPLTYLEGFLDTFINFLKKEFRIIKPYMINNQGFVRKKFLKYLEDNYGEDFSEKE